ncbi:hypothetical protein NC653_038358 [Populus alba x Populus x berolinensis]|uniref:Uncharacterized protein n=1 Tax=Populus alba x Populus x berolinensis TaxID=444605 RepID=A0AAD6LI09_9ROSI|nr:hypothetical protein NC653_038358 [Populus alba x Populus x berolinensis]
MSFIDGILFPITQKEAPVQLPSCFSNAKVLTGKVGGQAITQNPWQHRTRPIIITIEHHDLPLLLVNGLGFALFSSIAQVLLCRVDPSPSPVTEEHRDRPPLPSLGVSPFSGQKENQSRCPLPLPKKDHLNQLPRLRFSSAHPIDSLQNQPQHPNDGVSASMPSAAPSSSP